ncbi:hypothetical protein I79_005813 [Cricetulus griseus]|uniref:Uncharacterized protein n=1 Tax=Cricetulus griseus TaxID=10029 RepID=G3H662_CRIGR|nr:hypothetical protein I79_005813 [Cricetulus griseus]
MVGCWQSVPAGPVLPLHRCLMATERAKSPAVILPVGINSWPLSVVQGIAAKGTCNMKKCKTQRLILGSNFKLNIRKAKQLATRFLTSTSG